MNTVQVVTQLSAMPEGLGVELRRQRVTVLLGVALSLAIPLPGSPIEATVLRNYFQEQTASMRDLMFKINEALPFDVERSCEYGFRLYERRYTLAFNPKVSDLLMLAPFQPVLAEVAPEIQSLAIGNGEVIAAIDLLRADQAQ